MILSLVLILALVYLKTDKFELFDVTLPIVNTPTTAIQEQSGLLNFIKEYSNRKNQQNDYQKQLVNRQQIINCYSSKVANLLNQSDISTPTDACTTLILS
jgi:hypothetical protein